MIEIILITFMALVAIWFFIEFKNASMEYDPFEHSENDLSKDEEVIFERYKREML